MFGVLAELSSDHDPILISFGAGTDSTGSPLVREVDWRAFGSDIGAKTFDSTDICDTTELENAAGTLSEEIANSLRSATSYVAPQRNRWLPAALKQLLQKKRRAKKRAQRTCSPSDIAASNALAKSLRASLKEFNNDSWW